ncbi:MAG: hypothetical protein DMF61_23480 [Blastocatellia bacterium AA13]|nr:MAG: hypothetical protein DMF61_23480 [Blastocatellia bacterium AA13]
MCSRPVQVSHHLSFVTVNLAVVGWSFDQNIRIPELIMGVRVSAGLPLWAFALCNRTDGD